MWSSVKMLAVSACPTASHSPSKRQIREVHRADAVLVGVLPAPLRDEAFELLPLLGFRTPAARFQALASSSR